jgi:hypothetical protein
VSTIQARFPLLGPRAVPRSGIGLPTVAITVLVAGGAAYVAVSLPEYHRAALAGVIALNLIVLGMKWPRAAVLGTLLFLPFLALIRRLLIAESGWISNDPLLLVGPVVAIFLVCRLYVLEGRRLDRDVVTTLCVVLLGLVVLLAFNPFGAGGLAAGLGGVLFLGVPLLWFFIGRQLGDERSISFILHAVIAVAIVVAAYGLFQTELAPGERLPQWDQDWYEVAGYSALNVGEEGNQIRPFSTFASNGEYSSYLTVALIVIFALAVHRRPLYLLAAPLLAFALFSSGGRAGMALTTLAIVLLLGALTRNLALGLVVIVLGVAAVYGLAIAFGPRLDRAAGLTGNAVSKRNVSGLLHPLDPGRSSVLARWDNLVIGVRDGFKEPLGTGTGASNIAGRNLSDSKQAGRETDNDVSDTFLSLGPLGGLTYVALIIFAFRAVFTRYGRQSSWMVFAVAGVLVVMFGNWLNGGLYAIAPLTWFLLGWASRPLPEHELAEQPAADGSAHGRLPAYAQAR